MSNYYDDKSVEVEPHFNDFASSSAANTQPSGGGGSQGEVYIKDEPIIPGLDDGVNDNLVPNKRLKIEEKEFEDDANNPFVPIVKLETDDKVTLEPGYEEANIDNLPNIDQYAVVEYLTTNPEQTRLPRDQQFGKEKTDDSVGYVRLKREGVRVMVLGIVSSGINTNYHVQVYLDESTVTIISTRCNSCFELRGSTGCCVHVFRFLTWLLNRSEDENGRHEYNFFRPSVLSILKGKTHITLQELCNEQYIMPLEAPGSFRKELCEEFIKRDIQNKLTDLEDSSQEEEDVIAELLCDSDSECSGHSSEEDEITMRRG